jgi:DNA-binding GntR family transcriptional regulator
MRSLIKMTLSEQIYSILREDIVNQNLQCGEKLTIKSLQERFNTSSTPIRDAMNRLSQDGLIDHVTNVGAKVVDLTEKDIREIYDFCLLLDQTAMKLSLNSDKREEVVLELRENIRLQELSVEADNMEEFKSYSDNFHDIFHRYANNSRLNEAAVRIRSQFTILTNRYQSHLIAKSVVFIEHKDIAAAIYDNDFNRASSLLESHFEHAKTYLLGSLRQSGGK